jgi:hypothetical protein
MELQEVETAMDTLLVFSGAYLTVFKNLGVLTIA